MVLTLNEAPRMRKCLSSLARNCDKVVVIDSFSTDDTLAEAERVWKSLDREAEDLILVTRVWKGFVEARNSSLDWVSTEWVLWVDADEWIMDDFCEALKHLEKLPRELSIFKVARQSYFLGRAIRFGGWYPDRKARLARTQNCVWKAGPKGAEVHEDLFERESGLRDDSSAAWIAGHLGHEGFRSIEEQEETNEKYSTLLAEGAAKELKRLGKSPPNALLRCVKPWLKFVENYLWKLGILDGYPGFVIARGSARSLKLRLEKISQFVGEAEKE